MREFWQKLVGGQALLVVCGGLIVIVVLIGFVAVRIGDAYKRRFAIEQQQRLQEETKKLSVRRIVLRKRMSDHDECLEIFHNGRFRKFNCFTHETVEEGLLSIEEVASLLGRFNRDTFQNLKTSYTGGDTDYTITIETTEGTKTITVTAGSGSLGGLIGDLVNDIIKTEEKVFGPTPVPGSSPTPTPAPTTPQLTPTPSPAITSVPTASPAQGGAVLEPFTCDMLGFHSQPIVVSGEVCFP